MSAVSLRPGYQILALNPGHSQKVGTEKKTRTHSTRYRVAPQLKTFFPFSTLCNNASALDQIIQTESLIWSDIRFSQFAVALTDWNQQ